MTAHDVSDFTGTGRLYLQYLERVLESAEKPDFEVPGYSHIFAGHTRTQRFGEDVPLTFHNLTMGDTGTGRDGYLSIVNADTLPVLAIGAIVILRDNGMISYDVRI